MLLNNNQEYNEDDNEEDNINKLFICTCFDTIKNIKYNDYIFDFINYNFLNEPYKLNIIQYDNSINNNIYNKSFNLSYFEFDKNNYYFQLINNIYFNFNKANI